MYETNGQLKATIANKMWAFSNRSRATVRMMSGEAHNQTRDY